MSRAYGLMAPPTAGPVTHEPARGLQPDQARPVQRLQARFHGLQPDQARPVQRLQARFHGLQPDQARPVQRLQASWAIRVRDRVPLVHVARSAKWPIMRRPRQAAQAPDSTASFGRARTIEPGDPLVRALAVCIRQAHARRLARRTG
jgi:hypothetical protein